MGRIPRADRIAIVREVESQIHERLQEQSHGEPDRDDILSVLARLDPPEAYISEESDSSHAPARRTPVAREPIVLRKVESGPARLSGILGITALIIALLSPLSFFLAEALKSDWPLLIMGGMGFTLVVVTGVLAIALAGVARLKSAWAIAGMVTGFLGFLLVILDVAIIVLLC